MSVPEATSTPPAPPVPLAALLARKELGLRLLAGPDDVSLHWVHTSEMADPYPYLLGGELLMTAGVQLTDPARYVERVVEAGAAALGFGVTPVYDTVPEELVEACALHGLPLVEVPPRTPFTAVARALWRLMAEARLHELRRVTEAQQALATAAARPSPVPAVLGALASRLGGRAVLFGADGTESAAAGREVPAEAARALRELVGVLVPGGPASASGDGGGRRLAAYALGGGDGLALGVATERRGPGDHTIAGVAVVLLSLLTAPHRGADATVRDGSLVRLLLGAAPAEVAEALGAGPWTVVHARGGDGTPFAAAALAAALGTPLVDTGAGTSSGTGAGAGATDAGAAAAPGAGRTVRLLLPASAPAPEPRSGWTLGVSAPADARELAAADTGAARALRRAEASRTPLARHRPAGFAGLVDPAEAAAYARTLLAPLAEPLTETLRVWLSLHGSWDRTAAAMDIHRNTVRQRIARCARLLDRDLDDPDVRMELWFALGTV
ncbi:PucR family transcriptional regulator [Streptomyces sp. NBC_00094]|uniref:PucR family transcriptional regulator ligand-binding domain-containing protein n=1 Tax=Streptomyces sp. NBC_00094 TaxID=2903620 RepID=UPI0022507D55|nr:PucR family transcriptional regulator [Streptomyces sp. NBC_00094]MCX5390827.1 PucR family transcriptional regulator [Streptomyces sp. NBC_00094]